MPGTIEIADFSKSYETIHAVRNISLAIKSGELFGLLGPDGAGKTTTMRSLCTLLNLDKGEMRVDGMDVRTQIPEIRAVLGYMPQRFSLYPDLTVEQNINFFADLFGITKDEKAQRIPALYRFSKLEPFRKRLAGALSGGMKQKLALSCTLVHKPRVLILDEPTTGVDPVSRKEFWLILQQLRTDGVTIMVSTPYMDEADLCDRVAFMYRGSVLALDKPSDLHKRFPYKLYEVTGPDLRHLNSHFRKRNDVVFVQIFGDRLHVGFQQPVTDAQWLKLAAESSLAVSDWKEVKPSVEDVFLHLMKQPLASE